jgi:hypothetical protein
MNLVHTRVQENFGFHKRVFKAEGMISPWMKYQCAPNYMVGGTPQISQLRGGQNLSS